MRLKQDSADGAAIGASLSSPQAFTAVFDRHFATVHRYLARRVGRTRADDLASETFLVAFERRAAYRDTFGSARPWLLGIATNLLRNERRSEQRSLLALGQLANAAVVAGRADLAGDQDPDIGPALAALEPVMRDALLLHVWGELSYPEIADALAIPIGTVRSRISRACAALRAQLKEAS